MDLTKNIIPTSFILPTEYSIFLDEFNRSVYKKWILKPCGRSQGKGIQIITKYNQVKSIPMTMGSTYARSHSKKDNIFIISRYLDNPLLLDSKKFDLRTYVLVTNYKPLIVWRYEEGFARVCFEDYQAIGKGNGQDPNRGLYSHLTNASFQKYHDKFNQIHGGKWPITSLFLYIELNYGKEKCEKLKFDIDRIYLSALKAV